MERKTGWLQQRLLTAMAAAGLILGSMTVSGMAQGNSGNGNRPDTPPGKSDDGPGNSGNDNGNKGGNGNSNKGGNGKSSRRDELTVTAKTATGSGVSIAPVLPDEEAANWRYAACLPNATSINLTFPLDFKLTNDNDNSGDRVDVELDATGRLGDKFTPSLPMEFTLTDNGATVTKNLLLSASDLSDGAYTANIHVRATPQRAVEVSQRTVHIHILVGSACSGDESNENRPPTPPAPPQPPAGGTLVTTVPSPSGTGFFTDGDFNLLENCAGGDIDGNTGGTFAIVARPQSNVISSSNPGNFYLNWILDNSGAERNLTIELSAVNLVPRGANAVHALQFDSAGNIKTEDNFDLVNEDGKPCGPSGPCTVKVGAGKKLWVNWHLTFAGKGQSAQGISNTCGQGLPISAAATAKDGATTVSSTRVNALGFVK